MKADRAVLIICDGMGDQSIRVLGEKTPLEVAKTPNLDKLAEIGITGLIDPVGPGIPAGSEIGHLAIFGYDVKREHPGRGPIEALGLGLEMEENTVIFRTNFTTVEPKTKNGKKVIFLKDRRAGRRLSPDNLELGKALNDSIKNIQDVQIKFIATAEHRGILVLKGKDLSPHVTDSDPHETGVYVPRVQPLTSAEGSANAKRTAEILNIFLRRAFKILTDHEVNQRRKKEGKLPANMVLFRGGGSPMKIQPFEERWGMKAACIAALPLYRGVARLLGMSILEVEGITGYFDSNIAAKIQNSISALNEYEFIFVHIKACDVASHDRKPEMKIKMIEKIDATLKPLIEDAVEFEKAHVIITSDHSTSSQLGAHIADPPPILIAGPNVISDKVSAFNERAVLAGGLHRIRGLDLMPLVLGYTRRAIEGGLKSHPDLIKYVPSKFGPPLEL
ncbi:MAG: 2,3-bisphosphoglycerate-independent phosphoglycerate mutase [Candidatus Hodarchaeota archaeon]